MGRIPSANELAQSLKTQGIYQLYNSEAEKRFNIFSKRAINTFFRRFDNHKVTREILGGKNSPNESGTLTDGNLFTFLGFQQNDANPIIKLRSFLQSSISVEYKGFENGRVLYVAYFPDWSEIYNETPLEWARGRSWVRAVEHGVSGLGRFLYLQSRESIASRSGRGIQIRGKVRSGQMRATKYLSELRRDFLREVEGFRNNLVGKRRR